MPIECHNEEQVTRRALSTIPSCSINSKMCTLIFLQHSVVFKWWQPLHGWSRSESIRECLPGNTLQQNSVWSHADASVAWAVQHMQPRGGEQPGKGLSPSERHSLLLARGQPPVAQAIRHDFCTSVRHVSMPEPNSSSSTLDKVTLAG